VSIDQVIIELYRLAETKKWDEKSTEKALFAAIEGMEQLWEQRQMEKKKSTVAYANRKQPRIWC